MKYAAFADLFDTETAHIVGFELNNLRWNEERQKYLLNPSKIKGHHVFLGKSSEIKNFFNTFVLGKDEIKNTYGEAQRDLIDAIFGQND
jgi:hypothetical protein